MAKVINLDTYQAEREARMLEGWEFIDDEPDVTAKTKLVAEKDEN